MSKIQQYIIGNNQYLSYNIGISFIHFDEPYILQNDVDNICDLCYGIDSEFKLTNEHVNYIINLNWFKEDFRIDDGSLSGNNVLQGFNSALERMKIVIKFLRLLLLFKIPMSISMISNRLINYHEFISKVLESMVKLTGYSIEVLIDDLFKILYLETTKNERILIAIIIHRYFYVTKIRDKDILEIKYI